MWDHSGLELAVFLAVSLLTAAVTLWMLLRAGAGSHADAWALLRETQADMAFLFDGDALISHTTAARPIVTQWSMEEPALAAFLADFAKRFPLIHEALTQADSTGHASIDAAHQDDPATLEIEQWDGFTRFFVRQSKPFISGGLDDHTQAAQNAELKTLRAIAEDTPHLIWRTGQDGRIDWANEAYLMLTKQVTGQAVDAWPPVQIFSQVGKGPLPTEGSTKRTSVAVREGAAEHHIWFDVFSVPRENDIMHFATNAERIVRAENSRRDFVQTLTKTFAHLSIGLAIFDKDRQLALFNPALLALVALPVDFLSQKPTLQTFLDRLRETQLIPEPKNYQSWRQQMSDLESQAADGTYCETWTLPGGLTYRVTGRPHPDGAIGFLFEDISAEVSLTRRFRSEIGTSRAVIDAVEEGIAVFSESGVLTMTNAAFCTLWNADPESSFIEQTINDVSSEWEAACKPHEGWATLRAMASHQVDLRNWTGEVDMLDGRRLHCRFVRIQGGATMAAFRLCSNKRSASASTGIKVASL